MAEYKPYLDIIFRDADALMAELSEAAGEFTNQQFLKEAARRSPGAYIDFLVLVKETRGGKWAFNIVHEHIGGRLSREAQALGYEKNPGSRDEIDIFGNPTNRVTYRRVK
ncbi:MAG: hypothetical protein K8S97_01805 [Anaerolineae bacterium]|nr:hypothetical protein [Anaerolineae bacterium]